MKIAVFGCKHTTEFFIRKLNTGLPIDCVITLSPITVVKSKTNIADYCDLVTAFGNEFRYYQANKYTLKDEEDLEFFKEEKFDIGFVASWQRIIPAEVLDTFSVGVFGMHGSAMNLPQGRGRSPLNWSIIEDKKVFYTNLFKYDAGVDSGAIVDTFKFNVLPTDTAESLHFKNVLAMVQMIRRNVEQFLTEGEICWREQRNETPTYYPKRTPKDSLIPWEADVFYIDRLIRAVAPPFNGAFTYLKTTCTCETPHKVSILRARLFDTVDFRQDLEYVPGQVMHVFPNGKFIVACVGGVLLVDEYQSEIVVKEHQQFCDGGLERKEFPVNQFGGHDLP